MQDSGFKQKEITRNNIPQEQFVYTRGGELKVMKKVVNSVLASALAVSLVPAVVGAEEAAATTAAPAMDPALQKVVKRLEALKLVAGYGNGDYGVEKTITRAEFATLVARARGLEQGAKLAQFQTNFSDVKASDWFAGFVNVASTEELVKGYTDNTFKPQNNVTYAEAVAMIIRALGYEPTVKGVWPNNYISKASELGVAKTIATPNNAATRGDVFKMLDNALNIDLMKQVEYGTDIRFEEQEDKSLLTEYLNVDVYDMDWADKQKDNYKDLPFVGNVPVVGLGSLKANEVHLFDAGRGDATPQGVYKVAESVNPNEYAGQHVQVWIKDDADDVVVWMEGSEDEEVINDLTDTFYLDGKVNTDGEGVEDNNLDELELKLDSGKTYEFSKDVRVTYNFKRFSTKTDTPAKGLVEIIKQSDKVLLNVKVVLDDQGKIAYIHAVDHATAEERNNRVKYGSEVIEKINAESKKIENLEGSSFTDLRDKEEGEDFLVFINGAPAKLADLKPLDVYSVFYADGKRDRLLVMAYRTVVEGKVDDVQIRDGKVSEYRFKIGDKLYRTRGNQASYSENANKDVEDSITQDQAKDLDGEEVKFYLGGDGRIRHIETKDDVTDRKQYALLTRSAKATNNDEWNFQVITESKAKKTIELEADDIEGLEENEIEDALSLESGEPVVLEVSMDKDGKVEEVEYIDLADFTTFELSNEEWDEAADEDDETVEYEGKTYDVEDDAVVFDMHKGVKQTSTGRNEIDDARVAKFSSIAEDDDKTVLTAVNDDNDVEFMFVTGGEGIESDFEYGLLQNYGTAGGDYITVLTRDAEGKVASKTIKLDDDLELLLGEEPEEGEEDLTIDRGDFISYTLNPDGEVIVDEVTRLVKYDADESSIITEDLEDAGVDKIKAIRVDEEDSKEIVFDGEEFPINAKTIFLDADGAADAGGVEEGDYAVIIDGDDDGKDYDYVVIVGFNDDIEDEDGLKEKYDENFLGQEPGNGETPEWDAVADDAEGTKVNVIGTVLYKLEVDLNVDADEVESAELEFSNGTKKDMTIEGDKLVFEGSLDADLTEATLTVKKADSDATDTADVTFRNR